MGTLQFAAPWALAGLLLVPLLLLWRHWRGSAPVWLVPYAAAWLPRSLGPDTRWRVFAAYAGLVLLVVAAARPQLTEVREEVISRGSDLVLAVDLSTSMLAEDYSGPAGPINRLEAVRPVIQAFVEGRPNDRIGIVVFAGRAYTLVPLTADHGLLARQIESLRIGMIEDGTALGDGLGIALTHFEGTRAGESPARAAGRPEAASFVVLLTDGANTSGVLTPPQATAIARHRGVPVYTIAAGRNGLVPHPVFDEDGRRIGTREVPSSVDLEALRTMSEQTGGRHFAADDAAAVGAAFADIDAAQRSTVLRRSELVVVERYAWLLLPALLLLALSTPALGLGRGRDAPPQVLRGDVAGGRPRFRDVRRVAGRLPWRLAAAALLALLALLRPPHGGVTQPADAGAAEIVIALDLSRSMLAADLAPDRLGHARRVAEALVARLPGRPIGLIGFAGTAHLLAPPSRDHALLREYLAALEPRHLRDQGTSVHALLETAPGAFGPGDQPRVLVLLSDGEADSPDWREALPALRSAGIRVVAVGFGTAAGAPVPADAPGEWLRDSRRMFVRSGLDMTVLAGVAEGSGGTALEAATTPDLVAALLEAIGRGAPRPGAEDGGDRTEAVMFALLMSAALVLLAWSLAREYPSRPRLARRGPPSPARPRPLLAAAVALCASGLLAATPAAQAPAPGPLQRPISVQEKEALDAVKAIVGRLVEEGQPAAADYLELAVASAEYGFMHRGHAHPISEGVLHDGLAAVALGRALDPGAGDWDGVAARLSRLLEPPPPVPPDEGEADPANEPVDARQEVPVPGGPPAEDEPPEDQEALAEERLRNVGGQQRQVFDDAEWRDPALALPLHLLQQIRGTDSPAELFAATQQAAPAAASRSQSW